MSEDVGLADIGSALLLVAGATLMLIAALGVVRFPDLMLRMHAATKAGAMGVGLIGLAAATSFDDASAVTRALIMVMFIMITLPVAAHVIGRAAYFAGVPLWSGTVIDELRPRREALRGPPPPQGAAP